MVAYSRVYDSRHLQADCKEPGSAAEPYARQSSMGYLYLFSVRGYRLRFGLMMGVNANDGQCSGWAEVRRGFVLRLQ